jgi:hypothetical protein
LIDHHYNPKYNVGKASVAIAAAKHCTATTFCSKLAGGNGKKGAALLHRRIA